MSFEIVTVNSDSVYLFPALELRALFVSEGKNSYISPIAFEILVGEVKNGVIMLLALEDNQAVGVIYGEIQGDIFMSQGVYVVPEKRRQSVAEKLKGAQIDYIRDKTKCRQIVTTIYSGNKESLALSKKLGFQIFYRGGPYQRAEYRIDRNSTGEGIEECYAGVPINSSYDCFINQG